jgi:SAM-dependent methyltransferase
MENTEPAYYDNLNTDVLDAIPPTARTVLEIGCGAGRLGFEYKKRNPDCLYYGVEIHAPAAAVAATRLDMALCGSVEALDLSFLDGTIDCIVYADVLEHLIDPWGLLRRHRSLLAEGGKIVACLPNSQHWSVVASLMSGNFTYQDNGLMDRTHLRFFTLSTIEAMFSDAGLGFDSIVGRFLPHPDSERFFAHLCPALPGLGIDAEAFRQRADVFQYLLTASRR